MEFAMLMGMDRDMDKRDWEEKMGNEEITRAKRVNYNEDGDDDEGDKAENDSADEEKG